LLYAPNISLYLIDWIAAFAGMTFLVTYLQTEPGKVWRIAMGKNLVIVGGGAGGPSTAAEAKRRDPGLNITIIERGEFVSFAS